MKKILIAIMIIILPIMVNAESYSKEINKTNNYILGSDYRDTYERYLKIGLPYGFLNRKIVENSEFNKGGLISKEEYDITSNKTLTESYLFEGESYWTQTQDGTEKHYVVGEEASKNNSESYRSRTTEYINNEAKITGKGTISDPWVFSQIYKVDLDVEGAEINYKNGQYIERDKELVIGVTPNGSNRYITNNCGIYFKEYNAGTKEITMQRVNRDLRCKVIFGTGIFKLTIKEEDTAQKEFYSRFEDGFYKDKETNQRLRKLERIPSRVGYTFMNHIETNYY